MAFPAAAAIAAGASIVSGVINSARQADANRKNIENQNYWNNRQLEFARNAYSIAAADKMRAGLSPLNTSSVQAPALTSPQVQAPQFPNLGEALSQGMSVDNSRELNASSINANNAQAVKTAAESADILAKLEDYNTTREARLQALIANYNNTRDKGSKEAQQMAEQIKIMQKSVQKQTEEINNLRLKNGELSYNIQYYSDVGLPINGPVTKESLAMAYGKRLAEKNNAKETDDVIRKDQERKAAAEKAQAERISRFNYDNYVAEYEARKKELDMLVYQKKLTAKEAKKQLGNLMAYGQWKKYYGY